MVKQKDKQKEKVEKEIVETKKESKEKVAAEKKQGEKQGEKEGEKEGEKQAKEKESSPRSDSPTTSKKDGVKSGNLPTTSKKDGVKSGNLPKEKAIVNGISLKISPKHCFAICKMLKGKNPDKAIKILEDVVKKRRAVPMRNMEVPHQKGKGIAGGRFPKKASLEIIELMKQLKANAIVNGIENAVITIAKANKASRPFRKGGRRAKRTHIYLEVQNKNKLSKKEKK